MRKLWLFCRNVRKLSSVNVFGNNVSSTVTLETIFSDWNKDRVQESKKLARIQALWRPDKSDYEVKREAAVLIPLCHVKGVPSVLFMQRSKYLRAQGGEICFPGGGRDKDDPDLVTTALRETHEEIGLPGEKVDVWGTLPSIPASMKLRSGHLATPVVAYCGELDISTLQLNHEEVETVFTRTVASLCMPGNFRQTQMRTVTKTTPHGYTVPVYLGGEFRIWGLTAIMLHQALTVIAPGLYTFQLHLNR